MVDERELERQLKVAAKTGNYVVGRREVQKGIKGSKLLVWSASANLPQVILDECKSLSVPAVRFSRNPVELGRACGIPFRVSVIALKSAGDADLNAFSKSSDYASMSSVIAFPGPSSVETKNEEEGEELQQEKFPKMETKKRQMQSGQDTTKKKKEKRDGKIEEEDEEDIAKDSVKKGKKSASQEKMTKAEAARVKTASAEKNPTTKKTSDKKTSATTGPKETATKTRKKKSDSEEADEAAVEEKEENDEEE